MNLNLEIDGRSISLYQTPTHISYMCQTHLPTTGKGTKAQNIKVMECYFIWIEHGLYGSGVFHTDEEYQSFKKNRADAEEHIRYIRDLMKKAKTVKAWVM